MDERKMPKGPGEILGMSGAYWKSLALHAGVRLDIFSAIGEARLGGAEIARRVGGDGRGVTTLLEALAALGLLLVHEFILDDSRTSPLFPALFSLNMLAGTAEGRSYSLSELSAMLAGAGARDVRLLPFMGPTESRVLAATV